MYHLSRIKLILQYKGTHYHGWQVQPNGVTVQEVLQKALSKIYDRKMNVMAASRTDSGVHALGQVCHFDIEEGGATPPLQRGLNSLLPPDISVIAAEPVSDTFHAQKSAKKKIYEYRIHNSFLRSPFLHEYFWQIPYPLDVKKMKMAAKYLVGKHDFQAFCASGSSVKTTVRRVYGIVISKSEGDLILITITGSGFLKQMVRNIVGTLTDVGRGKILPLQVKKILKSRDRRKAGPTAVAKGLILKSVIY